MMKILLTLLLLGSILAISETKKCKVYSESEIDSEFESMSKKNEKEFKKVEKNTKTKKPKDKNSRKKLFKLHMKEINKHNKKEKTSFCQGPNKFAAMDEEERQGYLGYKPDNSSIDVPVRSIRQRRQTFPSSVDHSRKTGPVENQAGCGCCWAFAASHTVTGAMVALKGQPVISYSEQQLVDCSVSGNGCAGAYPKAAYEYLTTHEFKTDAQYPYVEADRTCSTGTGSKFLLSGWGRTHTYGTVDVDAIKAVLVNQPIAVVMYVTQSFFNYESGVYVHDDYEDCTSNKRVNHGMTLVGYGRDYQTGLDYWLIKNSWGSREGEQGYYRVKMGDNVCNIEIDGLYPIPNSAIPQATTTTQAPQPTLQTFRITITTATDSYSSTTGVIKVSFYNTVSKVWSNSYKLSHSGGPFNQGQTDRFYLTIPDTGNEDEKRICLKNPSTDGWKVAKVILEDADTGKTWKYGYNFWVDSPDTATVTLSPRSSPSNFDLQRFTLTTTTATDTDSSTTGEIKISFYNTVSEVWSNFYTLSHHGDQFGQGQTEKFYLTIPDTGKEDLKKITLKNPSTDGWKVEKASLEDVDTGKTWKYYGSWIDSPDIPEITLSPANNHYFQFFTITTITSTEADSSTTGEIKISFFNTATKLWGDFYTLSHSGDQFGQGQIDTFTLGIPDTGNEDMKKITLLNPSTDGWKVAKVIIEDSDTGKTWTYGYDLWIDSPDIPVIILSPKLSPTGGTQKFKLTTVTRNGAGSATKVSGITIEIHDQLIDVWSDPITLDNTAGDKFRRESTDTFTFSIAHTGIEDLKRIRLGNPSTDGWEMERVILEDRDSRKTWTYGYNMWLDSPITAYLSMSPSSIGDIYT